MVPMRRTDHVEDGRPRPTLWISASFEQSDQQRTLFPRPVPEGRTGHHAECPRS